MIDVLSCKLLQHGKPNREDAMEWNIIIFCLNLVWIDLLNKTKSAWNICKNIIVAERIQVYIANPQMLPILWEYLSKLNEKQNLPLCNWSSLKSGRTWYFHGKKSIIDHTRSDPFYICGLSIPTQWRKLIFFIKMYPYRFSRRGNPRSRHAGNFADASWSILSGLSCLVFFPCLHSSKSPNLNSESSFLQTK